MTSTQTLVQTLEVGMRTSAGTVVSAPVLTKSGKSVRVEYKNYKGKIFTDTHVKGLIVYVHTF